MPRKETKHDAFLRLMQRRLGRALEELRLVGQLSSLNYENTPEEAQEVISHLDNAVRGIAAAYGIEYASRVGRGASQTTAGATPMGPLSKQKSILDEIAIAQALDYLRQGNLTALDELLRKALT